MKVNGFIIPVRGNCRARNEERKNFSVLTHVSEHLWNDRLGAYVERSEKAQINNPVMSRDRNLGVRFHYRRHNAFLDQERYDRMSSDFVKRQGVFIKYYTVTMDVDSNSLFHEDNLRTVDREFDFQVLIGFQPQKELYDRYGIQFDGKMELQFLMTYFLECNYQSLREHGIKPACAPTEHNPIWYQRGYEDFRYYGYTAQQIFPKAGDMLKFEFNNILYQVTKISDEQPEYEYKQRKYWWKVFVDTAVDSGQKVSDDVLKKPEQENFINNLLGKTTFEKGEMEAGADAAKATTTDEYPFAVNATVDELKKDVLFRPPEVPECVDNITESPSYQPCEKLLGGW